MFCAGGSPVGKTPAFHKNGNDLLPGRAKILPVFFWIRYAEVIPHVTDCKSLAAHNAASVTPELLGIETFTLRTTIQDPVRSAWSKVERQTSRVNVARIAAG
jgi:hypothetical protein